MIKTNINTTMKRTALALMLSSIASVCTICLSQTAYANDGSYYMSGNQLVPMHTTQIDVKKEVLNIRREGDDIVVDVHYELYNSGKPMSLLVGFEAMPPSGDVNGLPKNGRHPYMSDFTAKINGKPLKYEVALVPTSEHWQQIDGNSTLGLDRAESPFYFRNGRIKQERESTLRARIGDDVNSVDELFVYHFSANFKQGKNTIDHHYRFDASASVGELFNFDYVLKAINRWGDSKIEDFKLTLDMGDLTEFSVLNTFFKHSSDWQLKGVGKIYPTPKHIPSYYGDNTQPSTTFSIRTGQVTFHKKNFTPKGNLYLLASGYSTINEPFNANKHDLSLNLLSMFNYSNDLNSLDDFSRKVLRNHPFARRGYVFKNRKLQAYYQRQPWYVADTTYHADAAKLTKAEQDHIARFK